MIYIIKVANGKKFNYLGPSFLKTKQQIEEEQ